MASIIRTRGAPDAGNKLSKGRQFTLQQRAARGYSGASRKIAVRARDGRIGDAARATEMHR